MPIGEPWTPAPQYDHHLTALPYAYAPDLENCARTTGHCRILAALPFTSAERTLKIKQGVDALERRLERARADFADPHRESVV